MRYPVINPAHWRLSLLLKLGHEEVHELACKAVGTLTAYRLVLGRCLLAVQESKGYRRHGCSSAIHYACTVLGMSAPVARECRRVAQRLQGLPELTLAAECGTVDWSKLREIVRRAVPATELYWLRLAKKCSYKEIEQLVSRTPDGSIPGEVDIDGRSYRSELRCAASPELFAMIDQVRRVLSVEKEEAVTTAEVLEMALASLMTSQPFDTDALERAREAADKDLLAEEARRLPVVEEARELAAEMGLLLEVDTKDECSARDIPKDFPPDSEDAPDSCAQSPECSVRDISDDEGGTIPSGLVTETIALALGCSSVAPPGLAWADITETSQFSETRYSIRDIAEAPLSDSERTLHSHVQGPAVVDSERNWQNPRLRFNPEVRFVTKAQRTELLRRDGWCCRTPGCPNRVWLHLHHFHEYSQGGQTSPDNLICLCSGCHRNVHQGILKITESPDGELLYTNFDGRRLDHQADLELAGWLDVHLGWNGEELDSHQAKLWRGEWSVFAS